ncbi:MAG: AAA family ATPase [Rickettsiales bacterium]|jgi:DNA replication and repair protein RecF|nr:AAA family ATPase [Rickettsiales bacterium]
MPKNYISEIILNNFRNYRENRFSFCEGFNILSGPNGRGKTNLLEAISLFSNSRGIKGARADEMVSLGARGSSGLPSGVLFSLFLKLGDHSRILIMQRYEKKLIKFNDELQRNSETLADTLKITYLVPQMDYFFIDGQENRRKFVDKTADMLFTNHYGNVKKYEFFLRERMKILLTQSNYGKWLDIVEKKIAELGTAIANVRNEVIERLNRIFSEHTSEFPMGQITINGSVENMFAETKAIEIENFYRKILHSNRNDDAKTKRTNFGVHRSDIVVFNKDKNIRAELCSTGEQKMLLLSMIVTRAIFSEQIGRGTVILLLDEVCSHIDSDTRRKLFIELQKLNAQIFLTGTSIDNFSYIVENGNNCNIIEL